MAVYHFTIHAYRSWSPDHPRGYVRRNKGVQRPDPDMARKYDERAKFPKVQFDSRDIQEILVLGVIDVCRRRGWRLHAVGTDPTHLHFVLSWYGFIPWASVMQTDQEPAQPLPGPGDPEPRPRWFVRDGSRKRVKDKAHLDHLVNTYLPDHRGVFWREG